MAEAAPDHDRGDGAIEMRVARLDLVGLRNLAPQELELGEGITLLWGPNGAGKTNLLEGLCLALAGRSCRTRTERETIAFDESMARVEVDVYRDRQLHRLLWSVTRGGERRHLVDGKPAADQRDPQRPALAIFLPDRLALVKGPPAGRRAHLDRFAAALWPARAEARRRYGRALAHRNALLGRVRAGAASVDSLDAWEWELGSAGVELARCREEAVAALAPEFASAAAELGLVAAELRYAPRSEATEPAQLSAELRNRREGDLARGHTTHGPHLDELRIVLDGRSVRRFGSQGEQRATLLALLFAERRALLDARRAPPMMLLDDVMSELDPERRELLARRLAEGGGQALLTTTEAAQLGADWPRTEFAVRGGRAAAPRSAAERISPPLAAA
jgi:DNA replication and repair protein RecF